MIEFMQNEIFDRTKLVLPCDGIPLLFSTTKKDSHGTVTQAVDGDVYQSMTCCCARIHLAIELSSWSVPQMNFYIVMYSQINGRSTGIFQVVYQWILFPSCYYILWTGHVVLTLWSVFSWIPCQKCFLSKAGVGSPHQSMKKKSMSGASGWRFWCGSGAISTASLWWSGRPHHPWDSWGATSLASLAGHAWHVAPPGPRSAGPGTAGTHAAAGHAAGGAGGQILVGPGAAADAAAVGEGWGARSQDGGTT